MRIFVLIALSLFSTTLFGQTFSESDIKKIANQINEQLRGLDIGNGITARGCLSIGRTLIYQYDVPSYWEPPINIKEELIANLKTAGSAKTYFLNDIGVDFYYYKGNSLVNKVSVKPNEFSIFNFELGGYISIKDHVKSKDVNLKLKVPQGWEVKEGDRPNIVKKFTKDGNIYLILIKDSMTFFSRSESKELLNDKNFINEFVEESSSFMKNSEVIDKSAVTIDTYPSLTFKVRGKMERSGITIPTIMRFWVVFYEDKIVFLQSWGVDNPEFRALEQLYFRITNSVIFPDQYN
jgi:hypothetical protein